MFELPKNETKRKGTNIKKCKKNWKTKKRWWPKRDCYQYHYQHKQNTNQHHHRRRRHHKKRKTNPPHFQQYFQRWRLRWRRWWWLWKAKAIATNPQFYNKVTLGSRCSSSSSSINNWLASFCGNNCVCCLLLSDNVICLG